MTQEDKRYLQDKLCHAHDKELLLKDLCARLPYEVKVEYKGEEYDVLGIAHGRLVLCKPFMSHTLNEHPLVEEVKPYLFPLSSLTEKQRSEISQLLIDTQNTFSPYGEINTKGCDNLFVCSVKQSNALINYCLMHHLDINGLIEKGLALDATGLNIY